MLELGDRTAYYLLIIYCVMMSLATFIWNRFTDIIFLLMALNCLYMFITQKPFELDSFTIPMIAFFAYSILTILWSANLSYAISTNISIIQRVVLAICVYGIIDSKMRIEMIIKALLIGGVFTLAYLLFRYGLTGILDFLASESRARLGEEITSANSIGGALSLAAVAAWHFFSKGEHRLINLFLFAIFFVFVLASGSRAAFFGMVIGAVVCSYYSSQTGNFFKALFSIALFVIGYMIVKRIGLMPRIIARFDEALASLFGGAEITGSARSRVEFAQYGFSKIVQNPIIGYGAGQFRYYMGIEKGLPYSSHNNYVEVLFSYGIVGGVIWYGMYFYSLFKLWKSKRDPVNGIVISLVIMRLISDIAGHSISNSRVYLILALAFACVRIEQNSAGSSMMEDSKELVHDKKSYIRSNLRY